MNNSLNDIQPKNVLIVDDHPENLRVLSHMLADCGYKVRKALDGESAIAEAKSAPPDIILLDILMPGMDGYVTCKKLKSDNRTTHIPVLFVSALDEVFDKVQAFRAGGIDYITKPFQIDEVLARVEMQLKLRSQQLQLEQLEQRNLKLQQEIIHRQQVEAALRQSEAKFAAVFSSSPNPIFVMTLQEGRFLDVNESFCRLMGYARSEVIGFTAISLHFWMQEGDRLELIQQLQETESVRDREVCFRVKSREIRTLLLSVDIIQERGKDCLLCIGKDITESKQTRISLEQANQTVLKTIAQ